MSKAVQSLFVPVADGWRGVARTAEVAALVTGNGWVAALAALASAAATRQEQGEAERRAKDAYNASLKDRYQMVRSATAQRQLVLGRARVSGPMFFVQSFGDKRQNLVFCVALAAHEIDAVEAVYFNDEQVLLDDDGYVIGINRRENFSLTSPTDTFTLQGKAQAGSVTATVAYGSNVIALTVTQPAPDQVRVTGGMSGQTGLVTVIYNPDPNPYAPKRTNSTRNTFTIVSGSDTFTLTNAPVADTVSAVDQNATGSTTILTHTLSGQSLTISGGTPGDTCVVNYQTGDNLVDDVFDNWTSISGTLTCFARVRIHTGAAGQVADPDIVEALPTMWTSAHTATGVAYLTVELSYDQNAFPSGLPNVSATVRGAKVFDPRDSTTAWSDNPALLARAYATHPLGANLEASQINDATVIAAANICDQSASYSVNGRNYTRPLYRAGAVYDASTRPQDALNDLCTAMGGRWVFGDGLLRILAGGYTAPVVAMDETWLHDGSPVQVQAQSHRSEVVNVITASFADEDQDFQEVKSPRVPADGSNPYIAEDGRELPLSLRLNAVQWVGQAQYIAACKVRYGRYGMTVSLTCNLKAYVLEVGDVVTLSLARFGWVNETFEVVACDFSIDGGIALTLKLIDPVIWDMDPDFPAFDPLQNTQLPSPLNIPQIVLVDAHSGTDELLKQADGTIVSRILIEWEPVNDAYVLGGGKIEIRYGLATQPESAWTSVFVAPDAIQAYLAPVLDSAVYIIKARAYSALTIGDWSQQMTHQVVGKTAPPSDPTGVRAIVVLTGVQFSWDAPTDADYARTILHDETTWHDNTTPVWAGSAHTWTWNWPPDGTHTVHIKHQDTTGNLSTGGWVVTFHVTGSTVGIQSATWYTSGGQPAQWYADVQDDYGNVIGSTPAYWISGGSTGGSIAIDTPQVEPEAATTLAEVSQDAVFTVHGSDMMLIAGSSPPVYQNGPNAATWLATYSNTTSEDLAVEVSLTATWTITKSSTGWVDDTYAPDVNFSFWVVDTTAGENLWLPDSAYPWATINFGTAYPSTQTATQTVLKNVTIPAGHTVQLKYQLDVRTQAAPDPSATMDFFPGSVCARMAVVKR